MLSQDDDKIFRISKLIAGYLSDKETEKRSEEIEDWLRESEKNRALFERICAQETVCEKIRCYEAEDVNKAFERFLQRRKRLTLRRKIYWWSACAVVILLLGVVGWQGLKWQKVPANMEVVKQENHESIPISGRPVLTLASGKRFVIPEKTLSFESLETGQRVISGGDVLVQHIDSTVDHELMYNVMEIPPMCDFNFTLSDGTKVWMNASSTLRYPVKFSEKTRTVYVEGEVYFEVAKDANRPFYVEVDKMEIAVLGTHFNVRAYPEEKQIKVTLAEGKVSACINDKKYFLDPNDQLCMGEKFGGVNIRQVDVGEELAWRRGFYIFKKSRLEEVASTLQCWYNVRIVMTSKVSATTTYTGVVNKEEPIEVFMRRLEEVSNVKCVRQDNTVMIY